MKIEKKLETKRSDSVEVFLLRREIGLFDDKELNLLRQELSGLKTNSNLPEVIVKLLYMRGVCDFSGVQRFFYSSTEHSKTNLQWLYDPFLMSL